MGGFVDLLVVFIVVGLMASPIACHNNLRMNSTIHANKNDTLGSRGGIFELGFYAGTRSDSAPTFRTLAIWYNQTILPVKTVVWMADRSMNLSNNATLTLRHGDLQVYDAGKLIWTSNTSRFNVSQAVILNTGNLVLYNTRKKIIWQSFDTPTDTLLPGQFFNAATHMNLRSWQDSTDWSEGRYSLQWADNRLNLTWRSPVHSRYATDRPYYWSYAPNTSSITLTSEGVLQATIFTYNISTNTGNISTAVIGRSRLDTGLNHCLRRVTLDVDGNMRMYSWVVRNSTQWTKVWTLIPDICRVFGRCGPFGICREGGQCTCAEGFHYINVNDTRQGCARTNAITFCSKVDQTMVLLESVDLPGSGDYMQYSDADNASVCITRCLSSCFCEGFSMTSSPTSKGLHRCYFKEGAIYNGQHSKARISYLRIGADPGPDYRLSLLQQRFTVLVAATVSAIAFLGALSTLLLCVVGIRFIRDSMRHLHTRRLVEKWRVCRGTLVPFTYKEIQSMTRDFADEIGRGGYGSVFKGHIGDSVVVAVKRLDNITPHETEFMNEVDSIGYIHHMNLVDLQGYCTAKENREKLLVYEYMERGSLDRMLFRTSDSKGTIKPNVNKSPILEWRSRFRIAVEIAKGLEYLHTNVRGRCIVHCDIKPENILLDSMLSAKVGDFGLVRTMSKEQTHTMTRRIRGTCGYLAPEWASEHTPITAKTDVYSYGMVLLEIVSGRRNLKTAVDTGNQADWYFPQWAFPKVVAGEFLHVVDPLLTGIVDAKEVERVLQVAFWCINDKPLVRPSMTEVVGFLEGQIPIELPVPQPLFLDEALGSQDEDEQYRCGSILTTSSIEASGQFSHPPPYAIEIKHELVS